MSEINLSSAVRNSLTSLQSTADLLTTTQERLATGNRINSALDDPTAFFTASALNNRASDLSTLLDAEQQAIRTVEVADNAISAIEDLVSSARAQANAALQTEDLGARATAAAAFDEILAQIELLAEDASFNGTNLLQGDNLQVIFNEDGSSSLTVDGFDFTDVTAGLGLTDQGGPAAGAVTASLDVTATDFAVGEEVEVRVGSRTFRFDVTDTAVTSITDQFNAAATAAGVTTTAAAGADADSLGLVTSDAGDITLSINDVETGTTVGAANGTAFNAGTGGDFSTDDGINAALFAIDGAFSTLRSSAASLGSDLSTIQVRQDFTAALINTLEGGAGDLTLADLNEEGANLLTLQTRQQLASTSLSFATQADQSVLSLFG